MQNVSFFKALRREGSRLALGAALFFCAMAAAQAQTALAYYYLEQCKLFQFGAGGHGGSSPWSKTGLDTSTVNNVIATRTLSITITSEYSSVAAIGANPNLIVGARWAGAPYNATPVIPTNVKGLGIRVSSALNMGEPVKPQGAGKFLTLFSTKIITAHERPIGKPELYLNSLFAELVVTGPVAPGQHVVSGIDPDWPAIDFEVVGVQRTAAQSPAMGAPMESSAADGKSPDGRRICNTTAKYSVVDILTFGGGAPQIEAKCTVDAKFAGGFSLPMGEYGSGDFRTNGAVSREVPFEVSVHTCGAGAKPKIAFNAQYGLIPGTNVLQLKDQGEGTTAKNLGVILTRQGGDPRNPLSIGQGGAVGKKYDFDDIPGGGVTANGAAEIKLGARYQRVDQIQSGVTGGSADSQVNFKIYYD
ncbi:fimbrial protein [Achromobacter marplatensis]|uniref:fimbrial protein n=1 Tax=Achromobacter marplatensis TaxID=470868 RepID=UPI0039F699A5